LNLKVRALRREAGAPPGRLQRRVELLHRRQRLRPGVVGRDVVGRHFQQLVDGGECEGEPPGVEGEPGDVEQDERLLGVDLQRGLQARDRAPDIAGGLGAGGLTAQGRQFTAASATFSSCGTVASDAAGKSGT